MLCPPDFARPKCIDSERLIIEFYSRRIQRLVAPKTLGDQTARWLVPPNYKKSVFERCALGFPAYSANAADN